MFEAWGRFVYRRRWWVLAVSGSVLVASALVAAQGGKLQSGGLVETSESGQGSRLVDRELPHAGGSTFTLLFSRRPSRRATRRSKRPWTGLSRRSASTRASG